jgi:glycosyltransferase involved in cell wall biosynthesis
MVQIAHRLRLADPEATVHVAGAATDTRTARYLDATIRALDLGGTIRFDGHVADMPAWYADKGVLLSTSMYESFGMNIGEAMAVGAFPVVHAFPGAERLWPEECLFADIDRAVALVRSARPGLYRDWVAERYGLERQAAAVLAVLEEVADAAGTDTTRPRARALARTP